MVDSINIRTSLQQIDNTQKVQQLKQKEGDVQQRQFVNQMDRQQEEADRRVASSQKSEYGRVDSRKERRRGGQDTRRDKKERRNAAGEKNEPPDTGGHIDIKV